MQLLNMFNVEGKAEPASVCYDAQIIIIEEGGAGYERYSHLNVLLLSYNDILL